MVPLLMSDIIIKNNTVFETTVERIHKMLPDCDLDGEVCCLDSIVDIL